MIKKEDRELIRISIITVLTAINIGVIQTYKDAFDKINALVAIKVNALVFMYISLMPFLLYLVILGLNKMHYVKKEHESYNFFYDLGILLTAIILLWTIILTFGLSKFSDNKFWFEIYYYVSAIVFLLITVFLGRTNFVVHFRNWIIMIVSYIKNENKK